MDDMNCLMEMLKSLPATKLNMVEKIVEILAEEEVENQPSEWIGTDAAAEALGVTTATVRAYLNNGKLEGRRLSERKIVVSNESVKRMRLAQSRF